MKAQATKAWYCRTWTWTKRNGWTSKFDRFGAEEEAAEYGNIHRRLWKPGELRSFEIYKEDSMTTKAIYTANKETGMLIERCESMGEAEALIKKYESEDKADGTYTEGFYDIVDEEHCSLI